MTGQIKPVEVVFVHRGINFLLAQPLDESLVTETLCFKKTTVMCRDGVDKSRGYPRCSRWIQRVKSVQPGTGCDQCTGGDVQVVGDPTDVVELVIVRLNKGRTERLVTRGSDTIQSSFFQ